MLRRAYATQLRLHRPTEDPEGFRRVRDAYEILSEWLRDASDERDSSELDPWEGEDADVEEEAAAEPIFAAVPRPPTPAQPPGPDPAATPDAHPDAVQRVLTTWLEGDTYAALADVKALGHDGQLLHLERLARSALADPRVQAASDAALLWTELARLLAVVEPKLASQLVDAAWHHAPPGERESLDLHSIDPRIAAARDAVGWPLASRRVLLQLGAGVPTPPAPRPAAWAETLDRVQQLSAGSPLVSWLRREARPFHWAAIREAPRGRAKRLRRSGSKSRWPRSVGGNFGVALFVVFVVVRLASLGMRWNTPSPRTDQVSERLKALDEYVYRRPVRTYGDPEVDRALQRLNMLSESGGPEPATARETFAKLAREQWFQRAWRKSPAVRLKLRDLREASLPPWEASEVDPLLPGSERPPR